ncbi:MAG: hypothetical protein AB1925_04065 [Actinomycetota bacterium]
MVAAGVLAVGIVLHVLHWILSALLGVTGSFLLLSVVSVGGSCYWYRNHRHGGATELESQLRQASRAVTDTVIGRTQSARHNAPTADSTPPRPPAAHAWSPGTPTDFLSPPQLHGRPAERVTKSGGGVVSALLLVPTLIVYAILSNGSFTSPWQVWWLANGLNAFFVVCVAANARTAERETPAVLLALAGTVIAALASSPSEEWSLVALLSTERTVEGYTYSEPPYDLLPWISRVPVLVAVLFVIAWSIARRRGSGWVLGLFPAAGLAWWSIWYSEEGMRTAPNWFTFWLLDVGVFVGGCVACLVAEAMTESQRHPTQAVRSL